jgi:hypothetical protein
MSWEEQAQAGGRKDDARRDEKRVRMSMDVAEPFRTTLICFAIIYFLCDLPSAHPTSPLGTAARCLAAPPWMSSWMIRHLHLRQLLQLPLLQ